MGKGAGKDGQPGQPIISAPPWLNSTPCSASNTATLVPLAAGSCCCGCLRSQRRHSIVRTPAPLHRKRKRVPALSSSSMFNAMTCARLQVPKKCYTTQIQCNAYVIGQKQNTHN